MVGILLLNQLGQLLQSMTMKSQMSYEYFNIFGTIELPDSLEINQVKTVNIL